MTAAGATLRSSFAGTAALLLTALLAGAPTPLRADTPRTEQYLYRSVSSSGQFIVYCPDTRLRLAVTGYVDTAKDAVLSSLGIKDHWKIPIVVTMIPPETTRPGVPLARLELVYTDEGAKIDLVVALREEQFREMAFPQYIIQAVLMEVAYRDKLPTSAEENIPPPAWLVEAIARRLEVRQTELAPNAALFRNMINTGRIPPIREFLESDVRRMDPTARTIFAECSASLLEMLTALPGGRRSLYQAVRQLRTTGHDPIAFLLANFPALGNSETELERWWTLGLARYSAADRYLALTVAQTDAQLTPLLSFSAITNTRTGEKETFRIDEPARFAKLRTAKGPLMERASELAALHLRAHPLMRPVIAEYQRITTQLSEGKGRNIEKPLASIANYREMIVERSGNIADYLNWFEATQMPGRSGAFDGYIRLADGLRAPAPRPKNDALSRYVDQVEREFQ